jgi:uncharacterized protein (TIGR03437 family)
MRLSHIVWLVLLLPCALLAQPDRLTAPIDARRTVLLHGNVHAMAQPQFDQGPVEPAFRLGYITLMLKKTDAQQTALEQLLQEQQDLASPNYHNWLTPEQYADRFGLSQHDLDKISAWLQSQGFAVEYTARGREWLAFSGTAGQVRATFQTEIHRYLVDGEMHYAAAAEPSVPAALEPVVAAVLGLDDFYPKPPRYSAPAYTDGSGGHSMAPGDLATIYDLAGLYQTIIDGTAIDGTGQSIVVVGESAIDQTDIAGFRNKYGLPNANLPNPSLQVMLTPGSTDPGIVSKFLTEADLDLEWVSAVARNATITYIYGTGADSAAIYAIDQGLSLASVVTESFGDCEALRTTYEASYRTEAQKASVEGVTWLASTGDTGAANCDYNVSIASLGLAVNFPASIPEITAVGGTEFNEGSGRFWNTSNDANGGSAASYIPEVAWNDTLPGQPLLAGGGGASSYYPKPAWQAGITPADNARDLPDIALDASNLHDPYNVMTGGVWKFSGGTSVSTPVFAGIVALLNQYLVASKAQSKPGLGNINPTLYHLAISAPSAFHDITVGDNIVPCTPGSKDCGASLQFGYKAGPGYDQVTGLGSVNAYNLVMQWPSTPGAGTTTSVTASATGILTSGSLILTATVSASAGSATPTGSVLFTAGSAVLGTATLSGTGATVTAEARVNGSQLAVGNNSITASYGGATGFGASSGSVKVTVTVPTVSTTTTVSANPTSITANGSTALMATVTAASGSVAPTGSVSFALGSKSLGTASLTGAGGTANASLTVNASQLNGGSNTIAASYSGETGFSASSGSVTVTVIVPTSIGGLQNAASFQNVYAPGMAMSVYGTNLALSTQTAYALPLPLTMAGASATVNGVPAPLYYVSPGQLNIQIPYGTTVGTAVLAVSNNGQATYSFPVSASAPGIYMGSGNAVVPNASGSRGQIYTLFLTGAGEVSPPVSNGAAPTGSQVPVPLLSVSMTIGGVAVPPQGMIYVGIPSRSVGTLQINFTVPPNAPLGLQPVVVTVGSAASAAANFTVQ